MYKNNPALARKWQKKYYNNGGVVGPDLEAEHLIHENKINNEAYNIVKHLYKGGRVSLPFGYTIGVINQMIADGVTEAPADMTDRERHLFNQRLDITQRGLFDHAKDVGLTAVGAGWDAIRGTNTGPIQSAEDANARLENAGIDTSSIKFFGEFVLDPLALVAMPLKAVSTLTRVLSKFNKYQQPPKEFLTNVANKANQLKDDPQLIKRLQDYAEKEWNNNIAGRKDQNGIEYKKVDERTGELYPPKEGTKGSVDPRTGVVRLSEIKSIEDFSIWMHEYGHILDPKGKPFTVSVNPNEILKYETAAQNYAIAHLRKVGLNPQQFQRGLQAQVDNMNAVINKVLTDNQSISPEAAKDAFAFVKKYVSESPGKQKLVEILNNATKSDANIVSGTNILKARPAKTREFTVQFPDGTTQTLTGDTAIEAISAATGKAKKTIQNAFAEGRVIKGPAGETYTPAGAKVKPDARVKTAGQLEGFDGSFSDLMREYGIDPRSGEADNILKHLRRGGDWDGFRFKDAPDLAAKKKANIEAAKILGKELRDKYMRRRMKILNIPDEAFDEFSKIWRTPLQKDKAKGTGMASKYFKINDGQKFDVSAKMFEDPATGRLTHTAESSALLEKFKIDNITRSPKYAEWRRFFKKWKPEVVEGKTADEQKRVIFKLLESTFLTPEQRVGMSPIDFG